MRDANDPIDWATWGALNYLLEDARLDIEAITGPSAGAMNAVVLAEVYLEEGRGGPRKILDKFQRSISDANVFPPAERKLLNLFFELPLPSMATQWWADFLIHYSSYDFNPLNIKPSHDHLDNTADFAKVRAPACPDIVIVQINPVERDLTPRSVSDIRDRLNEITFNGALLGEIGAIDFVNRLIDSGKVSRDEYMRPFVHRIDGGRCLES